MIDGVMIKPLIRHPDERGFFEEMIRKTDSFFAEGFAQASHSYMVEGVVKAWHYHTTQVDWWYVVRGRIKAVLYDMRKDSPTHAHIQEFCLSDQEGENIVVKIPPGVAHGLKVLTGPCDLVYITSHIYDPEEEGRIAYDDRTIGYDWVQGKPISNTNIT